MIRLNTYLFALLLCLTATRVSAQFTTGSRFIGGGFSVNTPISPEFGSPISVVVQPELGRFRSPNVATGYTLTLGFENEKPSSTKTNSTYTVGFGPFIQRFLPVIPSFGFVLTARTGLLYTRTSAKTTGQVPVESSTTDISLGLSGSPGLFYQVSQRWLLLLDLGAYDAVNVNYSSSQTTGSEVKNSEVKYAIGRTFSLDGSAIRIRYFIR